MPVKYLNFLLGGRRISDTRSDGLRVTDNIQRSIGSWYYSRINEWKYLFEIVMNEMLQALHKQKGDGK